MFHKVFEQMVDFSSSEPFEEEIKIARLDYEKRTGDLFETDDNFEQRIASFLEWYVLDRMVSTHPNKTPAKLYIEHRAKELTTPEINHLRNFTRTTLSLFQFRKARDTTLFFLDLLNNQKCEIFERRKPAGLETGDILEARTVPLDEKLFLTDAFLYHHKEAYKQIIQTAKLYRKQMESSSARSSIDFVHRVAYLSNRCHRYKHVNPRNIFEELTI